MISTHTVVDITLGTAIKYAKIVPKYYNIGSLQDSECKCNALTSTPHRSINVLYFIKCS